MIHLATAALVNAVWDLHAKVEEKPLWRLIGDLSPEQFVACVDFRYLEDVLPEAEAIELLQRNQATKAERIAEMEADGYPTYTTSAGWLGYSDDELRGKCRDLTARGWSHFKIKVGANPEDDRRRCRIIRDEIGWERRLMIDANQVWGVDEAIERTRALAEFRPWFIEEPTSPDDVLGHAKIARAVDPILVATGEMCCNRVMFKQFLQAGGMQICQADSCRLGGVNEVLAVLLLARKFNVPVCFHAGGVGLCEYVQHLAMIDYVQVSASLENRVAEYADHLHEHFVDPLVMRGGRYQAPSASGYSATMKQATLDQFSVA